MSVKKLSTVNKGGNVRKYGVESIRNFEEFLQRYGFDNPWAFTNRFDLVDIFEVLPALERMLEAGNNIRNPSGLLWRMLEARERREKKAEEGETCPQ